MAWGRLARFVLLAAFLSGCGAEPNPRADCAPGEMLEVGDPLPECRLPTLNGSGEVAMADLRGTPLVLNFWASWCEACLKEMPALDAYDKTHEEVRVVGVDVLGVQGETLEAGRRYYGARGVDYLSLADDGGQLYGRFAFAARPVMPLTVVVDADGIVRALKFGPVDEAGLAALVEDALP